MFCGNCGNKVDDNAKFCPVCGNMLQAVAAVQETIEQAAAPVQETIEQVAAPVQETVEQAAAPVQETVEQAAAPVQETVEQVATPVQETVEQVAEPVQETIEQAAAPVQETIEQVAAPVQEAVAQAAAPVEQGFDVRPQPAQPFQPENAVPPAQNYQAPAVEQPAPGTQAAPFVAPAAPAEAPKKKKSKAGLIAGVTAAAVVAGGAGVGYFGFHSDITRMMMGDVEYAKMISKNAFGEDKKLGESMDKYVSMTSASVESVMKSARTTNDFSGQTDASAGLLRTLGSTMMFGDGSTDADVLASIPDGTSLSAESSMNVQLGSVFALLDSETTQSILDAINNTKISAKFAKGDANLLGVGIADESGKIGEAEIYMKDGNVLVALPGLTDKTLYIPKEKFESVKPEEGSEPTGIDTAEIKRIREEIVKIYFDSYETANITYDKNGGGVISVQDISCSVSGTMVQVVFTPEQLKDMLGKMCIFLRDDEYLRNYANEAFGISGEDYRKTFDDAAEKAEVNVTLTITNTVDVHNNVLSTNITVSGDNSQSIGFEEMKNGGTRAGFIGYRAQNGKSLMVYFADSSADGKNGKAVMNISGDIVEDLNFGIDCNYTGKGTAKFIGSNEVPVGKYVVTLHDPDNFIEWLKGVMNGNSGFDPAEIADMMSAGVSDNGSSFNPDALLNEVKKLTITVETKVEGDVYTESTDISVGDIGSMSFSSRTEKKSETVSMPDPANSISIDDEDALGELAEEAVEKIGEKLSGSSLGSIYELGSSLGAINGMGGLRSSGNPHYAAYEEYMEYSADNYSNEIFYELDQPIREAMAQSGKDYTDTVIRLYYKDGKPEVIDDGGFSDITFGDHEDFDSIYTEIIVNSRVSDGITGVTTVFTDDRYDIPYDLPGVFNYMDNMYPWESTNMIDDYIVGTYPYLYTGEPTSTELPKPPFVLDELNSLAEDVAGKAEDILGQSGNLAGYRRSADEYNLIEFEYAYDYMDDGGMAWSLYGCYANDFSAEEVVSDEFIDEMITKLTDLTDSTKETRTMHAGLYFKNGILTGAAVVPYDDYSNLGSYVFPTAENVANGEFEGWDSEKGEGYIDYYGTTVALGTYLTKNSGTLGSKGSGSIDGTQGYDDSYDGVWLVTEINGMPLAQYLTEITGAESRSDDKLHILVDDGSVSSYWNDDVSSDNGMYAKSGYEYEGEYAFALFDPDSDSSEPTSWFVPDGNSNARLIETVTNMEYSLVWESDVPAKEDTNIAFGAVKSSPDINDVAGRWHAVISGENIDFFISTSYILAKVNDGFYADSYSYMFLNPTADGFNVHDNYALEITGSAQYSAETDTLKLTDSNSFENIVFERISGAPQSYPYFGDWTLDSYDGINIAEYAQMYDSEVGEITMNLTIDGMCALMQDAYSGELWTVISPDNDGCKIAYSSDSSVEVTVTDNGTKLHVLEKYDDGETHDFTFVRGTYQFS